MLFFSTGSGDILNLVLRVSLPIKSEDALSFDWFPLEYIL